MGTHMNCFEREEIMESKPAIIIEMKDIDS